MQFYRTEENCFHLFANRPGIHGQLIATTATEEIAKAYLLDLLDVPHESWSVLSGSHPERPSYVSDHSNEKIREGYENDVYFTIEPVNIVWISSNETKKTLREQTYT